MFQELVDDDSLTDTTIINLMNAEKDLLEGEMEWAILKAVDVSQSANAGDSYLTMKTLPANFSLPSPRGIFVGSDIVPYKIIPFEQRIKWQSTTHRFYLDLGNGVYALCGSANPGGVIQFFYQKFSPALAFGVPPATGTPWIFPARFHKILPYRMAKKFFAIDQGDKSRAYDDRWDIYQNEILEMMRSWNFRLLKDASQNDMMGFDTSGYPNIIDMDGGGGAGGIYG